VDRERDKEREKQFNWESTPITVNCKILDRKNRQERKGKRESADKI